MAGGRVMWRALATTAPAHLCWWPAARWPGVWPALAGCSMPGWNSSGRADVRNHCQPGRQDSHPLAPLPWHHHPDTLRCYTLLPVWSQRKQKIPNSSLQQCKVILYEALPSWAGQPCSQHILALASAFFCEVSPWLSAADELLWDKDRWNKGTILRRD